MEFVCPICKCRFLTEGDFFHHMKIHPSFEQREKLIKNEVLGYRDYLYRNGGGHYDNFGGFDYDDPRWKRLSSKLIRKKKGGDKRRIKIRTRWAPNC